MRGQATLARAPRHREGRGSGPDPKPGDRHWTIHPDAFENVLLAWSWEGAAAFPYCVMATPVRVTAGIVAGRSMAVDMAAAIPLARGPFELSEAAILLGLAIGFGIPIAAALMPLWLGTRISVREALAAWGVASVEPEGTGMLALLPAGRGSRVSRLRTAIPRNGKQFPV